MSIGEAVVALSVMVAPSTKSSMMLVERSIVNAPGPLPTVSWASTPCSTIEKVPNDAMSVLVPNDASAPESSAFRTSFASSVPVNSSDADTPMSSDLI